MRFASSPPTRVRLAGVGRSFGLCLVFGVLFACQTAPSDLREWSPKDHTNTSNNKPAEQTGQVNANPTPTETPPKGLDPVTLATWGAQCASCHGKIGKGDGPNGKMVKATDLSNPDWQAQITDEQVFKSIIGGKNAMPAFANLPPETVENLVWLVRWFNSDQAAVQARMERLKAIPATSTAPSNLSPSTASGLGSSSNVARGPSPVVPSARPAASSNSRPAPAATQPSPTD